MSNHNPPIKCTPCRVMYNGEPYRIFSNGVVMPLLRDNESGKLLNGLPVPESEAKLIRREASRLRRNRNARERDQARRDCGLTKTKYGWE